jgi:flagellar hook-associated protein 3 FlgL
MIGRVATFAQTASLMNSTLTLQAKMAEAQAQQASGLVSNTYGGLSDGAGTLLRLNAQLSQLTADKANAATASSFVNEAYSSLGDISDLATKIQSQLASYMSANGSNPNDIQQFAGNMLSELENMLNSTFGGRYLFSGTSTNIKPVDLSDASYDPASDPTTPDTAYYHGSTQDLAFISSGSQTNQMSVEANAPPFEAMFRALTLLQENPGSSDTLSNAYNLVGNAVLQIGTMRESVSSSASFLTNIQDESDTKIGLIQNFISAIKNSDIAQSTVQVTQDQTQLQALYSTLASLFKNSLVDYLR